jgi:hypothetical protein
VLGEWLEYRPGELEFEQLGELSLFKSLIQTFYLSVERNIDPLSIV